MPAGGHGSFNTPPRQQQGAIGTRTQQGNTTHQSSDAYLVVPRVLNEPRTASQASSSKNKGTMMPSNEDKMLQSFQDFIDEVHRYAWLHVNVPSTQSDSGMPNHLKQYLLNLATKTTANRIMSNQNTRYFLVSKLIFDFIRTHVFAETSFAGFDRDVDDAVRSARKQIYQDTPPAVRKVYLQAITKQFTTFKANMEFEQYMTQLVSKRTTDLWQNYIRPLKHVQTENDFNDLHTLMLNAHKIALSMLSDDTEFKFEFPQTNMLFNEDIMIHMDPEYRNMSARDVMAAGGLVRLGALPEVSIRMTANNGFVATKRLIKAGVLIMLPPK